MINITKQNNIVRYSLKKNPFGLPNGNFQSSILIFNYNSNNKVIVTLFNLEVMLAPSVNPLVKKP